MMKTKITAVSLLGITLAGGMVLSGCTKERPYDTIYKPQDLPKNLIDTSYDAKTSGINGSGVYLYVSSMMEGPHSTDNVFPGEMGDERLVRFRFTEKALVAETVELDPRFNASGVSNRPLVSIPVTHHAYQCAENGAGECSNKEEENSRIDWKQKDYFRADMDHLQVQEVNSLDIDLTNYFSMGRCLKETGQRVIDFKVEPASVKIVMERDYQKQPACMGIQELWQLPSLTFSMRQVYSFVKRNELVSKDYQVVQYPETDADRFGFFTSKNFRLSADYKDLRTSMTTVMERWNPNRKVIRYGLTENFGKPENRALLDATIESVRAVNQAFSAAGVELQIELENPSAKDYGDIRNSMIVLVEEPLEHGVLGYGPAVADPITGEIVSARTVMYSGNLTTGIRVNWDDYIAHSATQPKAETAAAVTMTTKNVARYKEAMKVVKQKSSSRVATVKMNDAANRALNPRSVKPGSRELDQSIRKAVQRAETLVRKSRQDDSRMQKVALKLAGDDNQETELLRYRHAMDVFSKKCLFPSDYVNVQGALSLTDVQASLKDVPQVSWSELSEDHRSTVISVLLPYLWIPTLVHELGHNMGLRHNFQGSEDKDNFYTPAEIAAHGHAETVPMKYSSVMDYGFSTFNELRIMGRYDVAALRFGYARQVEVLEKKGDQAVVKTVPVETTLEALLPNIGGLSALKPYKYCTDENVGSGLGCHRFDEGTTYGEIAQHMLRAYEKYYTYRNFRGGARSYHYAGDGPYIQNTLRRFFALRPFMDIPEMVADIIQVPLEEEIWKQHPFLKPYREAYDHARTMFLAPLKTPNVTCRVGKPVRAGQEPVTRDIEMSQMTWEKANLGKGAFFASCFEKGFTEALMEETGEVVYGHLGKATLNQKFENNPDSDAGEIDVRGIWPDRIVGLATALSRETGYRTSDTVRSNYFEMDGESREEILQLVDGYLMNRVPVVTPMKKANGETVMTEALMRPNTKLPRIYSKGAKEVLGLPGYEVNFAETLLTSLLREMWTPDPSGIHLALREYYGISYERDLSASENPANFIRFEIHGQSFMIDRTKNEFALSLLAKYQMVQALEAAEAAAAKAAEGEVIALFQKELRVAHPNLGQAAFEKLFREKMGDRTVVAGLIERLKTLIEDRKQALYVVSLGRVFPPKTEEEKQDLAAMEAKLTTEAEKSASQLKPEFIEAVREGDVETSAYLATVFETLLRANRAADSEIRARGYIPRSE